MSAPRVTYGLEGEYRPEKPPSFFSFTAALWPISMMLAKICGVICAIVLLLFVSARVPAISDLLPRRLQRALEQPVIVQLPDGATHAVEEVKKGVQPARGSRRRLGVGATENEVRAVLGAPDRIESGRWYYGDRVFEFRDGVLAAIR